ncbi:hypothetical protein BDN72DRAFT_848507, partial [Pluteus cervinus]
YHEWTVVTQVSRSWRMLAFDTKRLWNGISCDAKNSTSPWVDVYSTHSRPLNIEMGVDIELDGSRSVVFNRIQKENYRVRKLSIRVFGSDDHRWIKLGKLGDWLGMEMPVLEQFEMVGDDGIGEEHLESWPLFDSRAPCLKSIHIFDFNLTLRSLPFTSITSLTLWYSQEYSGSLSLPTLFDFLRISRLQSLDLRHALSSDHSHDEDHHTRRIPLPSLQSMTIYLPARQCLTLLSHILISRGCTTNICGFPPGRPDGTSAMDPREFFDQVPPLIIDDPTEIGSIDFRIEDECITIELRRLDELSEEGTCHHPSPIQTYFQTSGEGERNWVPSFSTFSGARWFSLEGLPHKPSAVVVREAIAVLAVLPSLKDVDLSIHVIPTLSSHLHDNPQSFATLTSMIIRGMEETHAPIGKLVRTLARRRELGGNEMAISLIGNGEWTKAGSKVSKVLTRLKDEYTGDNEVPISP